MIVWASVGRKRGIEGIEEIDWIDWIEKLKGSNAFGVQCFAFSFENLNGALEDYSSSLLT